MHNPERSLPGIPRDAREKLGAACAILEDAVARGLCGAWGIASWDPAPLAAVVDGAVPAPSVLMVPAGLLAGIATLDAAQTLAEQWQLGMEARSASCRHCRGGLGRRRTPA